MATAPGGNPNPSFRAQAVAKAAGAGAGGVSGGVTGGGGRTEREVGKIEMQERAESPRVKNQEKLQELRGKQRASEELARKGERSPYEQNPRNPPTRV